MFDSDLPCEYCEDDFPGSQYIGDGKEEFRLCGDCQKEWEEKLGYSHRYAPNICPTCHHLRGLRIVKYKKDDPEVKQCSDCGDYFTWVNSDGRCEECLDESRLKQAAEEDESCPKCKSPIIIKKGRTISGWATEAKECTRCEWQIAPVKKFKLDVIVRPEGVPTLESYMEVGTEKVKL